VILAEGRLSPAARGLRRQLEGLRPRLVILDSIALLPAARLSWSARPPLMALMHLLPSALVSPSRRWASEAAEAAVLAAAGVVVATSPDLARRLQARGLGHRIVVLAPGRDGVPLMPRAPERETPSFLCVANWSRAKGIHLLVDAFSRMGIAASLDLVGSLGVEAYAARIRALIERFGLRGRVRVHGPLVGETLGRCYAGADVFVLPSLEEGYGTVVAEALHAGLPVIASDLGPIREMVTSECGLLVPPGDKVALTTAMDALARDPQWRQRAAGEARRRAAELPTWNETTDRFVGLVRELLVSSNYPSEPEGWRGPEYPDH